MIRTLFSALIFFALSGAAIAHDPEATYIANEGVLVTNGETKIMFDPLPLSGFGTYPEPSADVIAQMMAGEGIYAGVDAVFISHAHRDHFSAERLVAYMAAQPNVQFIMPRQASAMLSAVEGWDMSYYKRIRGLDSAEGSPPIPFEIGNIAGSAVHIPHSGWPRPDRASVQNMVYRVTLGEGTTVMHMGDADVNLAHYRPHEAHWQAQETDMAFPPYWLLIYPGGPEILEYMNIKQSVGTHVPIKVPDELEASGVDYFSVPGETRVIDDGHSHD